MTDSATGSLTRLRLALRPAVRPDRLVIVAKAAVAAAIAWALGLLMPGDTAQYAYYAPLGAILAMAPTVVSSVRGSVQLVIGLTSGIAIAWALVTLDVPMPVRIALAVAVGTLVAGVPALGAGRDYVPVAALFTLILGGGSALGDYSLGYIAQMATGLAVGVAINLLIAPPLRLGDARDAVSQLKHRAADVLDGAAETLADSAREHTGTSAGVSDLPALLEQAHSALDTAWESRRINPRARKRPFDSAAARDDVDAMRRIGRSLEDLDRALADGVREEIPTKVLDPMRRAVDSTGALLRGWGDAAGADARCDNSAQAHRELRLAAGDWDAPNPECREQVAVTAFSLRTIHDEVVHRTRDARR
jgi:uncharacterized membrane protein YgaE (UPF0421/DUF939 family)